MREKAAQKQSRVSTPTAERMRLPKRQALPQTPRLGSTLYTRDVPVRSTNTDSNSGTVGDSGGAAEMLAAAGMAALTCQGISEFKVKILKILRYLKIP